MLKIKFVIISLFMICFQIMSAQQTVSGVITDADGIPLPGAIVMVKGATNVTTSDLDGNYSLSDVNSTEYLEYSFLGMVTKTILVGTQSTINVTLEESSELIDEIVIVGYGKQSRASVTGAIATVGADEIGALPVTNAEQALQGRAPGLTVLNQGVPGSTPLVLIRGLGTFGNNSPLFVIDGIIVGNLSGISPNDIESVSILKDASTTAIYGARGSNGVVVVTTKTGRKGEGKLSYETYFGNQVNTKRYDIMNTVQYLQHAANLGVFPDRPVELFQNNTDWQDEIYQTGTIMNHKLTYSGGGEKGTYLFSAEYLDQEGVIINTGFERYSLRANSNTNFGKLSFGQTMAVSFGEQLPELSGGGRSLFVNGIKAAPYLPVYNPNNDGGFQGPSSSVDGQDSENPVRIQTHQQTLNRTLGLIGNIYGQLEIIEGLNFKSQVGLDYFTFGGTTFTPTFNDDSVEGSTTHAQDFAFYGRNSQRGTALLFTNSLSYNTTISRNHNFEILALAEKVENKFSQFGGSSRNLITNEVEQFGPTNQSIGSSSNETNRLGYLGRLNYNFDNKYIASFSLRRDASSRFGSENRWGTFPSASLGWNISKESFMVNSGFDILKLRASYGITGNDNIGDYLYSATLASGFEYPLGGGRGPGVTADGGANPSLKWEETTITNIGLDMTLFDYAFTATFEYFRNKSDDLLLSLPAPLSNGINSGNITANVGSVQTQGLEVALGYNDTQGAFKWSANLNLGTSNNDVLSLGGLEAFEGGSMKDGKGNISRTVVGESLYHFYGFVSDGIYQNQAEVEAVFTANPGQSTVQPGDVRYKDLNGDGNITSEDRTILADPYPDFTYGLNLNANYMKFDLNLFVSGVQGVEIYNTNKYDLEGGAGRLFNGSPILLDSWRPDNPSTTQPRVGPNVAPQNHGISDRYIEDGSFARLKNISIGYTLDIDQISSYISKLRIYVSGQNLITVTDYTGLDPEIGQGNQEFGIDRGLYPQPKSFLVGLQASF